MIKIAGSSGGKHNLLTTIESYSMLVKLRFTHEQIVAISSGAGSALTIKTVVRLFEQLRNLGFNHKQITTIARVGSAHAFLETIPHYFQVFSDFGFNHSQIAQIASRGLSTMRRMMTNHHRLISAGLRCNNIAKLASYGEESFFSYCDKICNSTSINHDS